MIKLRLKQFRGLLAVIIGVALICSLGLHPVVAYADSYEPSLYSEETTYEPTDEPADEPGDDPTDEPNDEPSDEPTDEPEDEPVNEPVGRSVSEPPAIAVSSAYGSPGEVVSITVSLEYNPGISGFSLTIQYPGTSLEFVEAVQGDVANRYFSAFTGIPNRVSVRALAPAPPANVTDSGDLFTIYFRILEGTPQGRVNGVTLGYHRRVDTVAHGFEHLPRATNQQVDITVLPSDTHTYSVTYQFTGTVPSGAAELLPPAQTGVTPGTHMTRAPAPTLPGYTFSGWTTTSPNVALVGNGFDMPNNDVVFTGYWTANRHSVRYEVTGEIPTGAPPAPATEDVAPGTSVTLAPTLTMEGYTFSGWATTSPNVSLVGNSFTMPNNDVVFTGYWTTDNHAGVDSWIALREAVNAAPANVPTTIEIAVSFAAPSGSGPILIPTDRQIILVSMDGERVIMQANWGTRHFNVNGGNLTLGQGITLSGGTVNNANNSGGVQVNSGGTLTMNEGSIIENNHRLGTSGGAVALSSSGSAEANRATFNMNGGVIRGNSAISGGGVSALANTRVNMTGGSITGNESNGGGGVFVQSGLIADGQGFYMTGGSITNNTSIGDGGGIFSGFGTSAKTAPIIAYRDLYIGEGVIFYGNTAGNGASAPPDNRLPHVAITSASIWDYALNNYDINYTGWLGIRPEPTIDSWLALRWAISTAPANEPTTIEVKASFAAPTSWPGNQLIDIPADRQIILVSAGTERVLTQTNGVPHFIVHGNLTLEQDITLSGGAPNNTNNSGGVQVTSGGTFTMNEGSVIENCRRAGAVSIGGNISDTSASAIFNMNGGNIRNNRAANGGGVFINWGGRMNMSGGSITGNEAAWSGGGVFIQGRTVADGQGFYMTGGSITNNTATLGDGGGIHTTLYNSSHTLSEAAYGHLYIGESVIFYGNTAGAGASAPPLNRIARIATTSASIWDYALNNYDISYRGWLGIRPEPTIDSWLALRWAISTAPANEPTTIEVKASFAAPTSWPGNQLIDIPSDRQIILVSTGEERVITQTNNNHRHFNVHGSLTLEGNITLSGGAPNNTNNSGGVQVHGGGTFTMNEGSVIENCRRQQGTTSGGAVALAGSGTAKSTRATFNMNGGVIRNNSAINGGGVAAIVSARINMSGGSIIGNEAIWGGGGVSLHSGQAVANEQGLYMTGGSITDNTVTLGDGGGIFSSWESSNLTVPATSYRDLYIGEGVIFSGNTAGAGASAPPDNRLAHIATTSASIWDYALNNYDINYTGRLQQPLENLTMDSSELGEPKSLGHHNKEAL